MSVVKRALFRATCAALVAACAVVTLVGFTQPWMIWAGLR